MRRLYKKAVGINHDLRPVESVSAINAIVGTPVEKSHCVTP